LKRTLILALSLSTWGQTPAPPVPAPAQTSPSLSFIAAGGAYNDAATEHWSAWGVAAFPLGKGFFNYNFYQIIPIRGKVPTSSMTPGAAFQARCGTFSTYSLCLYLLGTIGVSTGSSATTLATTVGGAVVAQSKSGFGWLIAWIQSAASGAKFPEFLTGASYSFGAKKGN
jgi:hypothetical protein